ncbi:hypothetical protein EON65_10840 [archaeon]|nr:MAG: hypothetical protein EON65_10840 [archaeon]
MEGTEPDRRGSITLIEPEHSDVEDESDDEESDETDGEDEYEDEPAVKKPSIFRKLSRGIVPIAASVGFAISPSPSLVGRIAGATVGGVGGFIARKIVLESLEADSNNGGKEFSVHPKVHAAIANLPQENLLYMDQQDLEELARLFRVPESELSFFYTHVLSEAILRSVSLPSMDLTELSEVMDYVDSIGFSRKEVGDAFTLAAIRIGEQIKTDNKVVYGANSFKVFIQASKAFFLADKLMGSLKGFYGKRVQVALSYFSQDQYQDTITEACKSLFRKCIESVLTDPTSYTKEEVEALRNFLTTSSPIVSTLRPADMESMVFEGIQLLLDQDVTKVHPLAARANVVKLVNAQKVLGWSSQELFSTIETKTMPVFKRIANSAVTAIVENPQRAEEISKMLEDGMKNLQVDKNKARNVLMNLIYGVHKDYLEQLKSVYDATKGQLEPVYRIMLSYAHTHSALDRLVQPLMEGFQLPLPGAPFSIEVRGDMYEELLQNGKLINGKDDHLLDLTDREKELVKEQMAIPKIVGWVTQCIEENNFNEFARDAYMKMLKEYNIESEYWEATTVDFYYEEVSKVANSRSVPTIEDMTRLASIKSFLQCSDVAARRVHLILFGVKYLKALTEAMTPSGIITEDYVAGLDRLRDRLLLSQEDAELLMSVAIRQQLGPLVKDIADIWKHNTDASYRREKERGEQQAKAEKMREPISSPDNVFGFLEMGAGKKTGGPNNYMQQGVDLKTRAEFPITAVGFTSEEDLIGMFKHFLITRVAEPDPAIKSRYNEVEDAYAKILGIDAESQMKLKESLAFSAFKNLLLNVLASKDKVEPKDIQQFIVLREGFRLEKEAAETVYNDAVQAALLDHTARVLASKESEVTPEKARTYREQVP